jgi:AP-1 complex subunit beta-1
VLDNLVGHISTLSSIYHKPPEFFIKDSKSVTLKNRDGAESSEEESSEYDESDEDYDTESSDDEGAETKQQSGNGQVSDMFGLDAMMGFDANANAPSTSASTHSSDPIVLQAAQGKGLQIRAVCSREIGRPTMTLTFENQSSQRVSNFLFKFNGNWLGATPGGRIAEGGADPNGSVTLALPLALGGTVANPQDRNVQIGMKCELGVLYFGVNVPAHIFFEENGKMGVKEFADAWRSLASDAKAAGTASSPKFGTDIDAMSSALQACNVFFIAKRQMEGRGLVAFFSLRAQNTAVAVEICINPQTSATAVTCKSANDSLAAVALQGILAHIN